MTSDEARKWQPMASAHLAPRGQRQRQCARMRDVELVGASPFLGFDNIRHATYKRGGFPHSLVGLRHANVPIWRVAGGGKGPPRFCQEVRLIVR